MPIFAACGPCSSTGFSVFSEKRRWYSNKCTTERAFILPTRILLSRTGYQCVDLFFKTGNPSQRIVSNGVTTPTGAELDFAVDDDEGRMNNSEEKRPLSTFPMRGGVGQEGG
jgi:hypothetical protein